jgi:hypothetical protein
MNSIPPQTLATLAALEGRPLNQGGVKERNLGVLRFEITDVSGTFVTCAKCRSLG